MKRLEELGISPAPWKCEAGGSPIDANNDYLDPTEAEASLIAAAPDLYECLREAVEDKCETCKNSWYGNCVTKDGSPCSQVKKWREALTKASGEDDESKMTDYIGKYQDDINMTMEERKRE